MSDTQLQSIVTHAYNTVQFYKELYDSMGLNPYSIKKTEDLKNVPVVTKDDIQKHKKNFLSSDFSYYPNCEYLETLRTSGSTGTFLKIYWSRRDTARSLLYLWKARNNIYGIGSSSKSCSFHAHVGYNNKEALTKETLITNGGFSLSFNRISLKYLDIPRYLKQMEDFKPLWLMSTPSTASLLAQYMHENSLKLPDSIKYVELAGEYLPESIRRKIDDVFRVTSANMYGCIETNGVALECRNKHLHCFAGNVIVEVLKDGQPAGYGVEGEIHLTCLTNKAMPFIRYALGDRGILYPSSVCNCGNKNLVLEVVAGRARDNVLLEGRDPVSCAVFIQAVDSINDMMGHPILQLQVIQEDYNAFTVSLVLEKHFVSWKDSITSEYMNEMHKLGIADEKTKWRFEYPEHILPNLVSGKLKFFHCNIKN